MAILDFVKPDKITVSEFSENKGLFHLKPLEPGYGLTLGNALRRVLLGSLRGFAITSIRIKGVQYEFSTIEGVVEDVTEIILNLKKIRLKRKIPGITKEIVNVCIKEEEQVTGKIFNKFISSFKILNTDLVICNKEKSIPLEMSFTIEEGRGYVPAEENKKNNEDLIGNIPIDSIYTPIKNVKYTIENCRVGQQTDFENLSLEIKTDGSICPKKALMEASKILIQYFSIFSYGKIGKKESEKISTEKKYDEDFLRMRTLLKSKLNDMDLSVRTKNCLTSASIRTIEDLVRSNRSNILKMRNFGKKSLEELESRMKEKGLYFGMDISEYNK
ncbi:MAG: DNA-directed RNA polymerase subunit alpha [Flavobacteriales bacterium]|jgi:DNA-directed RNA polymerase subunit alpha|uniref:DNA-directed RNA polymerase subunit alpha n=1 Tax=Blattabacterium sp. (Mastotermes darwiniensis) TaxID=39768 RepID=UPI000231DE5A|nr:DNA-directed RNA polymerase subunit alpha [Blattabacterium sp. (Mastotermes darwiniensis)]AER40654.1 DNA-directed RNA polymerase subunit alpha [Blattabacterium sp. (Mastotermes darwiniensis) str. MADAR]MDR1804818.1 DNA-directed RNA polymerase subunit alpha [Flavobacteriales bacterium]